MAKKQASKKYAFKIHAPSLTSHLFNPFLVRSLVLPFFQIQYREIAPHSVEDAKLHEIIKANNNDDKKIKAAIEAIWHGTTYDKIIDI